MQEKSLFKTLVKYHIKYNLDRCLPIIDDGVLKPPYPMKKEVREGYFENPFYNGLLIVTNGDNLEDKVIKANLSNKRDMREKVRIYTEDEFFDYLNRLESRDGGYLIDCKNHTIRHVHYFNSEPNKCYIKKLPADFVSSDRSVSNREVGLRTRAALQIAIENTHLGFETYQIKQTAYTKKSETQSIGMGKVTHFNGNGLCEEFFFKHAPESNGPFISEEKKIVGVYRKYLANGGCENRIERLLSLEELEI